MTPCCDYHAKQDICQQCERTIETDETRHYGQRLMAKRTFFSPAEYECGGTFCLHCWDAQQQDADRDEERRSLRGYEPQDVADNF